MHRESEMPSNSPSNSLGNRKTRPYKLVVLGDGGVGKSALTMQFVASTFVETHDPTIEDAYRQQCVVDGEIAHLDILDTAGQREFTAMREQYMRSGEGFILCYSITDRRSFEEVREYKRLVDRVRCNESIPIVLVGNKVDLDGQRKVGTDEGRTLADRYGCPFLETSAARRQNVDDIFHDIIREVRRCEQEKFDAEHKKDKKGFIDKLKRFSNWTKKVKT